MSDRKPQVEMDQARKDVFLAHLSHTGRIQEAATLAGCSASAIFSHRRRFSDFDDACKEAMETFADRLEAEAVRRAVDGWEEPVFGKMDQIGSVRRFDSGLLTLLLKKHRPAFVDRLKADLNVTGGVLVVDSVCKTYDELKACEAEEIERAKNEEKTDGK